MGPLGVPEMLFILLIALLIFGPKRLPEFGRTIGRALGEFRRATTDLKQSIDVEMMSTEATRPEPSTRASAAAAAGPVARDDSPDKAGDEDDTSPADEPAGEASPAESEDDGSDGAVD